mmetsp:Transcript_27513/g.55049  ORF Transcript_27513/g.55049 Transcript_27513/m.55049 type:complete len:313 (-) Transcript_27513:453-1391(-)|eukprot:CAMPEP_0194312442 /NCGR_PEP_ID=MMETSP0171-20130528/9362_1 /TAXON_ID=218684 /ORGANISM="Corethron pennatum, Strain L29A3" /LENGTH=312 /DNA_ID=CAMNT_0039066953 /DNA_START=129 /DNA_END=1067 /DNA_ORIENTATION=-
MSMVSLSAPQHATHRTPGCIDGSPSHGRWTVEEHRLFLQGLEQHGDGWNEIGNLIQSRTVVQIRTHAQKYFKKLMKGRCHDGENHVVLSKKRKRRGSLKPNCDKSIAQSVEKKYGHDRTVVTTTAACDASITSTLEPISSALNTTVASSAGITSRVQKRPVVLWNQGKCSPQRVDDIFFFDSIVPSSFETVPEVDKLLQGVDVRQALPSSINLDTLEWTALDDSGGPKTPLRTPPSRDTANTNDLSIPSFDFEQFLDSQFSVPEKQWIPSAKEIIQEKTIGEIEDDVIEYFGSFDEQSFASELFDSCDENSF